MKVVIMIPTYNERENVGPLLRLLRKAVPSAQVLVVDDSSPDGTAGEVERLRRKDRKLHLLLRDRSVKGRGWAGREGFLKALAMGAGIVVEMDGDLSHQPKHLPALLEPVRKGRADLVIGSRFMEGGRDLERPLLRRAMSVLARGYLKAVLGLKVQDPTSGFRVLSRKALQRIRVGSLAARDPFTVTEILHRAHRAGLRIEEVPIEFVERAKGESKLGAGVLVKYLARAFALRFTTFP